MIKMNTSSKKKVSKKSIIENDEMLDAIEEGHNSLGTDITDVYQKISDLSLQQEETITYVKERFKRYAGLAGKLSEFMLEINSKKGEKDLSEEEANLLGHVREVLELATNVQNKINEDILKRLRTITSNIQALSKSNNELIDQIMDVQDKSRVLTFMAKSMQSPDSEWYTNMLVSSVSILKNNQSRNT